MSRTVYFLGAGASRASRFALPCMRGFFAYADFTPNNYPELVEFVDRRFGTIKREDLNVEEVVTCLELSMDPVGSFGQRADGAVLNARRQLDKYVAMQLKVTAGESSAIHEKLFGKEIACRKDCENSIITLNYDLVIDQTLYQLLKGPNGELDHDCMLERMYSLIDESRLSLIHGRRPALILGDRESGRYLKLHGSLDWLYCSNDACPNHRSFFANWMGSPGVHSQAGESCIMCGAPLMTVLVPPTMLKNFDQFPKLGFLWSLAHRELSKADQVVVFGVSFAESDYYLRWLFRSAIAGRQDRPRIFDINVSSQSAETIARLTGTTPIPCATVDDYLGKMQP